MPSPKPRTIACPQCHRAILLGGDQWRVPYVRRHLLCSRCGCVVTVIHPKYAGLDLSKMRSCLDCGEPMPDLPRRKPKIVHVCLDGEDAEVASTQPYPRGETYGLSRTCPSCWLKHRKDEPGENLDDYVDVWRRGRPGHPANLHVPTSRTMLEAACGANAPAVRQ